MKIGFHTDTAKLIEAYYDLEASQPPTKFTVWLDGDYTTIVAHEGEAAAATWQRVLKWIDDKRDGFIRANRLDPLRNRIAGLEHGDFLARAHVFAGIPLVREIEQLLWRPILVRSLYRVINGRGSTVKVRLQAIDLLATVLDVYPKPAATGAANSSVQRQ